MRAAAEMAAAEAPAEVTAAEAAHMTKIAAGEMTAAEAAGEVSAAEAARVAEVAAGEVGAVPASTITIAAAISVAGIPIAEAAVIGLVALAVVVTGSIAVAIAITAAVIGASQARSKDAADYTDGGRGAGVVAVAVSVAMPANVVMGIMVDRVTSMGVRNAPVNGLVMNDRRGVCHGKRRKQC